MGGLLGGGAEGCGALRGQQGRQAQVALGVMVSARSADPGVRYRVLSLWGSRVVLDRQQMLIRQASGGGPLVGGGVPLEGRGGRCRADGFFGH